MRQQREVAIRQALISKSVSVAGFTSQIRFVRNHQQKIERVRLVTDSPVARGPEALAKHFTAAEIKHLPFADYEKALGWLKTF